MSLSSPYQDPALCRALLDRLQTALDGRELRFMEVCGTHTVSIFQSGLRSLLPKEVTHLSGPGCPVCVTHDAEVAAFLDLAGRDGVIIATFGDLLRVLPGETIPVDGIIVSGQTAIDQSVMTGESLPVDKGPGDTVSSGTVNQFGAFDMRAVKVGEDSSLQRMIRLVQSADAGKARIVSLADRWATWIVVPALTAAAGTWIVTGEVLRAVTILVVFCPCALVLATPTAIMAIVLNLILPQTPVVAQHIDAAKDAAVDLVLPESKK